MKSGKPATTGTRPVCATKKVKIGSGDGGAAAGTNKK